MLWVSAEPAGRWEEHATGDVARVIGPRRAGCGTFKNATGRAKGGKTKQRRSNQRASIFWGGFVSQVQPRFCSSRAVTPPPSRCRGKTSRKKEKMLKALLGGARSSRRHKLTRRWKSKKGGRQAEMCDASMTSVVKPAVALRDDNTLIGDVRPRGVRGRRGFLYCTASTQERLAAVNYAAVVDMIIMGSPVEMVGKTRTR